MRLQEALASIASGIKGGFYEPDQFEGWKDAELIEFAEAEMARGEMYANYYKSLQTQSIEF
jgi:hypothetical protein